VQTIDAIDEKSILEYAEEMAYRRSIGSFASVLSSSFTEVALPKFLKLTFTLS